MFLSPWRLFAKRTMPTSRQIRRRFRSKPLHCEELEPRCQPTAFIFSTGTPDGRVATIGEPPNTRNSHVEFESADDFALTTETVITHASFTGLLTGGATPKDVSNVVITIYRVFPNDSDVSRTSGPPTFSTPNVPTRVNSPGDNEIENRDSAAKELNFNAHILSASFTAQNSVSDANTIRVKSGGNGPATGEEVEFDVVFRNHPLDLPAGHYFFVPKVGLTDEAPAGADFLWLSAPRPIVPPGIAFPAGITDLQSWMRDDPGLAPDWLRIGTDIIDGNPASTFNASFALSGHTGKPLADDLDPDSALGQLRYQYGFHFVGSYFQSYHNLNAKWFQDRNTTWYALFPDGGLKSWKQVNGQDKFTDVGLLDPSVYANPQLLFQATETLPAAALAQIAQVQQTDGFHYAGSYWQNYLGLNEKWLKDKTGAWFVLTTDGQLRRWLGGAKLDAALAVVDPAVWDQPDLLFGV